MWSRIEREDTSRTAKHILEWNRIAIVQYTKIAPLYSIITILHIMRLSTFHLFAFSVPIKKLVNQRVGFNRATYHRSQNKNTNSQRCDSSHQAQFIERLAENIKRRTRGNSRPKNINAVSEY